MTGNLARAPTPLDANASEWIRIDANTARCEFIRMMRMNANTTLIRTNPNGETGVVLVDKELSYAIVGCAYEVHNELGFGYSESVYARSLAIALEQRGFRVRREVPITVMFRGVEVGNHRLDLVVEERIVIEVKTAGQLPMGATKQLRRYLVADHKRLGILINFGLRLDYQRVLAPGREGGSPRPNPP